MEIILRNVARCKLCGDIIESRYRHDFVTCSCGEISVDGGKDYLRRGFNDPHNIEELSVWIPSFNDDSSETLAKLYLDWLRYWDNYTRETEYSEDIRDYDEWKTGQLQHPADLAINFMVRNRSKLEKHFKKVLENASNNS